MTEQERTMCTKICSFLPSKGYMFEESPFLIDVFASAAHKRNCFEEIVAEPLATIKGDYEFLSLLQNLEEIVLSKMDD